MRQPIFGSLDSSSHFVLPLRSGIAQAPKQKWKTSRWQWRIDADRDVSQGIEVRTADIRTGKSRLMLMRGVNANSGFAAHNTQQTLVVHGVEQSSRGVR